MLGLTFDQFDQSAAGWRSLATRRECKDTTAAVIASYRAANWHKLSANEVHMLYWHEGQLLASAGQNDAAVPLMMAGVSPRSPTFANYALATIAFLHRDLDALKAARTRLATVPEPATFKELRARAGPYPQKVKWPPNLDVVDGLIACFGKSYAEAYSPDCRKK